MTIFRTHEGQRLEENHSSTYFLVGNVPPWEKWGPYVAERGWGTVREDYSANGDAWNYFPHDHARFRAYRRAEDGLAGISDRFQVLLFAMAFWNGKDPILKERLFGLNAFEGNHGEDVKEHYYYLDATPSHSYLKYLYKYPQNPFPYAQLVAENQRRGLDEEEFELIDTAIFDENRYFDLFIEYAKASPEDLVIKIEAINRGPDAAPLHILPHLWFRNQWSWGRERRSEPRIQLQAPSSSYVCLEADDRALASPFYLLSDYHLGPRYLYGASGGTPLFTNNDSHRQHLWNIPNETPYVKDAFHRYLIQQEQGAVNPAHYGTKSTLHYFFPHIPSGASQILYLRFTDTPLKDPLADAEALIAMRRKEADHFYDAIHPRHASDEEKKIQRQAFAGMIWSKQMYLFDVSPWLQGDNPDAPPPESHRWIRNIHWRHLISMRIFSMPDKWEYPWFAAWDLTFHALVFSLIDIEFAKQQLWLLLFDQFQHPNGAIPSYEWEFSDVNPPVQAFAALELYETERKRWGREDLAFLERCFHKLLLNFSWWINKVDSHGNNIFEGGFLGMDNIGLRDRSDKLPPGYFIDQADGAGWMALFCLNLMKMALILAKKKDRIYEALATKFLFHFLYIGVAMRKAGYWRPYDLWNAQDGFFYSVVRGPNRQYQAVPIRSLVGLIPFFACDLFSIEELQSYPEFYYSFQWIIEKKHVLSEKGLQLFKNSEGDQLLLSLIDRQETTQLLQHIWNPNEFRSEYGLRSVSKYHELHPFVYDSLALHYEPGEAREKIKGGNSNWRGPIWFPMNYLLIHTLKILARAFEGTIHVQAPGENAVTLQEMALSYQERLTKLFIKNKSGERPLYGKKRKLQEDPHFQDHLCFYEHFHGDNGRGLGASHQNGWTGLIANLIDDMKRDRAREQAEKRR